MTLEIEDITDSLANRRSDMRFRPHADYDGHERVIYAEDKDIGFRAFIAVHNTARGPALGGCRYWSRYASDEEAISDVLRLSRGMTYKNSVAGLPIGGGKSVIIGKPGTRQPSAEVMQALGKAVNSLGGMYVTAEDVGTSVQHILIARGCTPYVAGVPLMALCEENIPAGLTTADIPNADPSPYTAYGTYVAIKSAVRHRMNVDSLKGLAITVKGYGHVAQVLCRCLAAVLFPFAARRHLATGAEDGCRGRWQALLGGLLEPDLCDPMAGHAVTACLRKQVKSGRVRVGLRGTTDAVTWRRPCLR